MAHFAIVSAAEPTRKALLSVRIVARNRTEAVKEADNRFCPASHRSRGHVLSHCRRDGHGGGARTDRVAMSSGVRAGAPWMNANLQDAVGRLVERLDSEDPDVLNRDSTRKGKLGMAKAPTKHRAPWTAAEVRELKSLARKKLGREKIAKMLKRTPSSVQNRAVAEGVSLSTR